MFVILVVLEGIKHLSVVKTKENFFLNFLQVLFTQGQDLLKDKAKTANDTKHSYVFKVKENDFYLPCDNFFFVLM